MDALPLCGLQHISRVCQDAGKSANFYANVLGFTCIKRPSSFNFEGAWLFGYGVGIHLIKGEPIQRPSKINPRADHLSFQCESLLEVEKRLQARGIEYVQATVMEEGINVLQLFFHDPDNNMIEICNCDLLPVVPLNAGAFAFAPHLPLPMDSGVVSAFASAPHLFMPMDMKLDSVCSAMSADSCSSNSSCMMSSLDFDSHPHPSSHQHEVVCPSDDHGSGGGGNGGSRKRSIRRSLSMGHVRHAMS